MKTARAKDMQAILFFRQEGFYVTEYPVGYSNWAAEAARNPGTKRIETAAGKVLWTPKDNH